MSLVARVSYEEGLRRMEEAREAQREQIFFFEHPDTITLGNSTKSEDLLLPESELLSLGYHVHRAQRGGRVTYHGPGQLVCYPVTKMQDSTHIRRFVLHLARCIIEYLQRLTIDASYDEAQPGVWVDGAKIAALGLSVQRGMTGHGFALNLSCDLSRYQVIVPCGLRSPVTSVHQRLGHAPSLEEAATTLTALLSKT
jgi:lipoyl(octanoyl) transferase